MVATYTILGRKIGSHVLAMSVLGSTAAGIYLSLPGKQNKAQAPPIQASSKDEEKFIQEFLKSVEAEDSKAKH
ncbi:hypothetical protein FQN49_007424 [Arthroderma sp. PD_2]|nr:hypothetical protein FQN49_007424 [Arthroderma sp. PD_2]